MNLGRIWVIAANGFREVMRDRVLYLIALYALGLVAAGQILPRVAANTDNKIFLDVGVGAINILGLLIAVFVGTGLINKEVEKRTVSVMIAKPISRVEFIVGKHLGLTGVLAVLVVTMTAILLGLMFYKQMPFPDQPIPGVESRILPATSLVINALFQILELSLIAAVAILFGVFTSSVLAMLLTIAIYLMGHLSRDLLTLGGLVKDATFQQVTQALYLVLPDLSRLDWKNQAVYSIDLLPPPLTLLTHAAYGLIYTALLLTLASVIFSRRQF